MTCLRTRFLFPLLGLTLLAAVPSRSEPAHPDSLGVDHSPAPLLVPGRPNPVDSLAQTPQGLARARFALGRELERQGQPAAAIAAYRVAVRMDPALTEAHYRMGRLFTAVGQHRVAAGEYAAELALRPGHLESARGLGLELAQAGDTALAIRQLEDLTRRHPADGASWQALGFAYSIAGRTVAAESALRRALKLDPRDADAWRDLGALMASHRLEREARDAYRRAGQLDPRDAVVWVNLGNLERRGGRFREALEAYREALARDSSQSLAWRGRVAVLDTLGRAEEAAESFRPWLSRVPDHPELRMEAMQRFFRLGRPDVAIALARDGVRAAPRSGEAHLALGMALHEAGREREALEELRRAQDGLRQPEQRSRVESLIGDMRSRAPDSLRSFFAADSLARESRRPGPAPGAPSR